MVSRDTAVQLDGNAPAAAGRYGSKPEGAMSQGRPNIQYAIVSMIAGRVLNLEGQDC